MQGQASPECISIAIGWAKETFLKYCHLGRGRKVPRKGACLQHNVRTVVPSCSRT